jgi:hypothetical protein
MRKALVAKQLAQFFRFTRLFHVERAARFLFDTPLFQYNIPNSIPSLK